MEFWVPLESGFRWGVLVLDPMDPDWQSLDWAGGVEYEYRPSG
jgi:hypothetical protein